MNSAWTGTEIVMFSHRSDTSISTCITLIPKPGSCPTENYWNFFPSYFSMTSMGAALPATLPSQVHSMDIGSFGSGISHNKNECLTWFFQESRPRTRLAVTSNYTFFSPLLLRRFTCTTHGISSIPSTTCKCKRILGHAAVLYTFKAIYGNKEKIKTSQTPQLRRNTPPKGTNKEQRQGHLSQQK